MHLPPAEILLHGRVANPEGDVAVILQDHVVLEEVNNINSSRNVDAHGERQLILPEVFVQVAHGAPEFQGANGDKSRQGHGLAGPKLPGRHGNVAHHDVVVHHMDGAVGELEVVVVGVVHVHVGRQGSVHGGRAERLGVVHLHPGESHLRERNVWVPELENGLAQGDDDHGHHECRNPTPSAAFSRLAASAPTNASVVPFSLSTASTLLLMCFESTTSTTAVASAPMV